MTAPRQTPIAVWALAGQCTVCGHQADTMVVFSGHREVRHRIGGGRPCVLPNPPQKTEVVP